MTTRTPDFDGETYRRKRDHDRLASELGRWGDGKEYRELDLEDLWEDIDLTGEKRQA